MDKTQKRIIKSFKAKWKKTTFRKAVLSTTPEDMEVIKKWIGETTLVSIKTVA